MSQSDIDAGRLRAARLRCGLQQIDLAAQLGVAKSLPGQWERGQRTPSVDVLKRLARLLGVSADWLLGMDQLGLPDAALRVDEARASYQQACDSPTAILSDYSCAPGLRDLASARELADALAIRPEEWSALASLDCEEGLTLDGYVGLLVLLRNASIGAERTRLLRAQRSGLGRGEP